MATFIPNVTDVFPEPSLFTPDFSFMDKMLQRRKAMYDQGFSQVNSAYNYINRETTNPYNTKVKDQFLRQAKDNLKNLSSMDLSQFQNVEAANSVFAPFHNNTDVVGDQAYTEHVNREIALGNSFRTKDGGKEFNQRNIDYITQQKNWFAQDTPDTWKDYYGSKRSYIPYYDDSKEVQEAMKNFKPSHTKTIQKNGFYLQVTDDKSYYEGEIKQYLEAVLSDKAKQQWRINGAVMYGDNPGLLTESINKQASVDLPKIQSTIDDLNIEIRREKDPTKIDELTKKRDGFIAQQETYNNDLNTIKSGDLKFLRKNSEQLGYNIYYNNKIAELAKGFSHVDIEQDIKFDDVAMMFWKNDQDWRMAQWKRGNEVEDRDLKLANDLKIAALKDKEGKLPLLIESGSTMPVSYTLESIKDQIEIYANDASAAQADLKREMRTKMGLDPSKGITDKEFNIYVKNHPKDAKVLAYVQKKNLVETSARDLSMWSKNANTYAATKMGKIWQAYVNLGNVKKKRALTPYEQSAYDQAGEAYTKYYHEFHDDKFTLTGASTFAYAINPADKDFKAAAGAVASYTNLDISSIGSVAYVPNADGTLDIRFTYQHDPAKTDWKKDNAEKIIKDKLAGTGASLGSWSPDNVVTIKNAKAAIKGIEKFDPYNGIDHTTRLTLLHMANTSLPVDGTAEFTFPMRSREGSNVLFRVVKQTGPTGDTYYLKSNRGTILTDDSGTGYSSAEDVGQNLKILSQQSDAIIKNLLNR